MSGFANCGAIWFSTNTMIRRPLLFTNIRDSAASKYMFGGIIFQPARRVGRMGGEGTKCEQFRAISAHEEAPKFPRRVKAAQQ